MSILLSAATPAADITGPPGETVGYGLPYQVRAGRPVLTASAAVGAVSVPGHLGPRVRAWLTMLLLPGPVLAAPGGGVTARWLFLSKPDALLDRLPAEVSAAGV